MLCHDNNLTAAGYIALTLFFLKLYAQVKTDLEELNFSRSVIDILFLRWNFQKIKQEKMLKQHLVTDRFRFSCQIEVIHENRTFPADVLEFLPALNHEALICVFRRSK